MISPLLNIYFHIFFVHFDSLKQEISFRKKKKYFSINRFHHEQNKSCGWTNYAMVCIHHKSYMDATVHTVFVLLFTRAVFHGFG